MIYIIPDTGDHSALVEETSRSQVEVLSPQSIRDFILQTDSVNTAFCALPAQEITVLTRHAATLLVEMPTVVSAVPGLVYTPDWMTAASILPLADWLTVKATLTKSGETAFTPKEAEKRQKGAPISLKRQATPLVGLDDHEPTEDDIE